MKNISEYLVCTSSVTPHIFAHILNKSFSPKARQDRPETTTPSQDQHIRLNTNSICIQDTESS